SAYMEDYYIEPSRQGTMDGLCGAYCIVNLMVWLYGRKINRKSLFSKIIIAYELHWELSEWITNGIDHHEIDHIINDTLEAGYYNERYPVNIKRPFYKKKNIEINKILKRMEKFLASHKPTERIIMLATHEHWTLICDIDECNLYHFDSSSLHFSKRKSYSLFGGETRHRLCANSIYFITRAYK
ncbi:hypothetical protein ACQ1XX_004870, partial [Escherichia coli]|nr:hypothetical protein [Escherichia coli]